MHKVLHCSTLRWTTLFSQGLSLLLWWWFRLTVMLLVSGHLFFFIYWDKLRDFCVLRGTEAKPSGTLPLWVVCKLPVLRHLFPVCLAGNSNLVAQNRHGSSITVAQNRHGSSITVRLAEDCEAQTGSRWRRTGMGVLSQLGSHNTEHDAPTVIELPYRQQIWIYCLVNRK